MEFKTHTKVEGNYIGGTIQNEEFSLTNLTSKNRTLPPLITTYSFNSKELDELIMELQLIKNQISKNKSKIR